MTTSQRACLIFVFVWFFGGGLGHFFAGPFFASIVPPWVPYPALDVVYLTGVIELLAAVGLLIPRLRAITGIALLVFIVCVTPANVYMLQHAEQFPLFPVALLWLRLPIQLFLMGCVWHGTRPVAAARPLDQRVMNSPSK